MEAAGVVLGALPLALYAIDNYHRCLQASTDFWRFESTLKLIRSHVFIQQQQLQITLRSIGLVNPTPVQLELHLRQFYPEKCDAFIDIIKHMEHLLAKLMDKLDIDSRGKVSLCVEASMLPDSRLISPAPMVRRAARPCFLGMAESQAQLWQSIPPEARRRASVLERCSQELLREDRTPTCH